MAVENGENPGADSAGWDSGYSRYVCVWNKSDYRRTDLWLSVGISDYAVYFYIVTSVQDPEYRERVARLLHLDNGERYRHGYWWYEPEDKSPRGRGATYRRTYPFHRRTPARPPEARRERIIEIFYAADYFWQ